MDVGDGCEKWLLEMIAGNGAADLCRAWVYWLKVFGFFGGRFTGYIDDCGKH